MFIPFAVDIPIAIAIFRSGRLVVLNWLILALAALIHLNHLFSAGAAFCERPSNRLLSWLCP